MSATLHPDLTEAQANLEEAEAALRLTMTKVQAECPHRTIYETPYQHLEYFSSSPALRICARCRLEEEAKGYSETYNILSGKNLDRSGRVFVRINRNDFYKLRIKP